MSACMLLCTFLSTITYAQLQADFSVSNTSGCSPLVVHFNDLSTGNPTKWSWHLGNGSISHQQHPAATYFNAGVYTVKLVVTNTSGADSVVKTSIITVHPNPAIDFGATDTLGCSPKAVSFQDYSTTATGVMSSWLWNFGDGHQSTSQHPAHQYQRSGQYTVSLQATNSFGCQRTVSKQQYIRLANITAAFTHSVSAQCNQWNQIKFNSSVAGAATHHWNFGDGNTSALPNPAHTYAAPGNYQVTLTVSNQEGCSDAAVQTVIVNKQISSFSVSGGCAGNPVNFQHTSAIVPQEVLWLFGDGSTSTDHHPIKVFQVPGNYNVQLITTRDGCIDTVMQMVAITPRPDAGFSPALPMSSCSPVTINFLAPAGMVAYEWRFGDGFTSTQRNPVHTFQSPGEFDVRLIVTNAAGCRDTMVRKKLVTIQPPRITAINGLPYRGCAPYQSAFSAQVQSPDAVVGWNWNFGDGHTSSERAPQHQYTNPGRYTVTLVITTAGGCKDTMVMVGAVEISNKPMAAFVAQPREVCAAGKISFTDQSTGADEWLWQFGDGGTSHQQHPVHQFGDTGWFSVRLIASKTGCRDTVLLQDYVRNNPPIGRYNIIRQCADPFTVQFRDSSIGGERYQWYFGDGDSSTERHPVHRYQQPGNYSFTFTVFHGGCSYTTGGTVHIIREEPGIAINQARVCRNTPVVFSALNITTSNISSYHWILDDGNSVTTALPTLEYIYQTNGKFAPVLITTNILGCTDTAKNRLEVAVVGPEAFFSNRIGNCINSDVHFVDSSRSDGMHSIISRNWNFGDGQVLVNNGNGLHQYQQPGIYTVSLQVKDTYGCTDAVTKAAAVSITKPMAGFALQDSIRCTNNAVHFLNQSSADGPAYRWTFGDGKYATIADPVHSYQSEGVFIVQLVVRDVNGCEDSVQHQQRVANPRAGIILTDTIASCPPFLVQPNSSSYNFTQLSWSFGEGSTADILHPAHLYTYPGNYRLQLKVKGFGDCADSAYKQILVKGPTGSFGFEPGVICTNEQVEFSATAPSGSHIIWDFADGVVTTTTNNQVKHNYDMPGYFLPRIILTDTAGCQVAIVSRDTVKVKGVQARMEWNDQVVCDSATILFSNTSVAAFDLPVAYRWSFGDGTFSSATHARHTFNQPGSYRISLKVTTQSGCVDSVTADKTVNVFSSPQVSLNAPASVCLNDMADLEGRLMRGDSTAMQWSWYLPSARVFHTKKITQSFGSDGNQSISLVVKDLNGCSDTAIASILVHPLPNLNAGTDTMICRGQTYLLQPTGAASYQWREDASLSCLTCSSAMVAPQFNTTYLLKGTSSFGCVAYDSVKIAVVQPFTIRVNQNDTLCAGESLQLSASGAATYKWFPEDGLSNASIANPKASPGKTTRYVVVGTDAANCFRDTAQVQIAVFPVPEFRIAEKMMTLPAGTVAAIKTSSSADITRWKWHPARDLSCTDCPEPVLTARNDVVYKAEVWNDGGCSASDKLTLRVVCGDGNVFIPNTFSPNNDGMNDVFYPRGKGITTIKSMKIFNRWGDLVFEKNHFAANDATAGWNGSFKGTILTPDVYVYVVDVVCDNSSIFTLKGNVTLIR